MPSSSVNLRGIMLEAFAVANDTTTSPVERLERIRALLSYGLTSTAAITEAERADLDNAPDVEEALQRLADEEEDYYLANADGSPGTAILEADVVERPVDAQSLQEILVKSRNSNGEDVL